MKKLIPAVFVSVSVNAAGIYNGHDAGNSDLYTGGGSNLSLAVQPGTGDSYGGSTFSNNFLEGLVDKQSAGSEVNIYGRWAVENPDLY